MLACALLHIPATYPWYISLLHIPATYPWYISLLHSLLHIPATYPCYISQLHMPVIYPCYTSLLYIPVIYPCLWSTRRKHHAVCVKKNHLRTIWTCSDLLSPFLSRCHLGCAHRPPARTPRPAPRVTARGLPLLQRDQRRANANARHWWHRNRCCGCCCRHGRCCRRVRGQRDVVSRHVPRGLLRARLP